MESLQFKSKNCPVPDEKCDGRSVSLASRECLNLLLRLCFDRDEAWALLASISEEKPLEWLRVGVIYRRLLKAADTNQEHRAVIDNALTRKLDPVSLGVLALYGAMILWEALAPARRLPRIRGWLPRALGSFVLYFYLSSYLPLLWDGYLAQYQFLDLSHLGTVAGAAVDASTSDRRA